MKKLNSIKDLKYGNQNREDLEFLMNHDESLSKVISQFKDFPYNDTKTTKEEIEAIIAVQKKAMSSPNWQSYLDFSKNADEDLPHTISEHLSTLGIDISAEELESFNEEIGLIITALKKHYNRPRPYQVAYYTEQDLNPFETVTGNSPSYPSGHACQGWFAMLYLTKKYPEKAQEFNTLAKMIENSRVILGVHYPSDNEFGKKIAETLINIPEFEKIF
jgi:hypothetical protein